VSQEPPEIPARIGPYRIVGPLGRGGMGVVFRGEPSDGGPNVAIKTVRAPRASALQSIRREIHALASFAIRASFPSWRRD
jgi:serine/threonine protein kinase